MWDDAAPPLINASFAPIGIEWEISVSNPSLSTPVSVQAIAYCVPAA